MAETIQEILTIKTPGEVADPNADVPSVMAEIPEYNDFFCNPELYQRIHVEIKGVIPKDPTVSDSDAGIYHNGFGAPSLTVMASTYGPDTGSTDYFAIGQVKFLKRQSSLPFWNKKGMVIGKKGKKHTEGLKITMHDGKRTVMEWEHVAADFPAMGKGWKEFIYTPEESSTVKGVKLEYKIRVTDCAEKISDKNALAKFLSDTDTVTYTEEVIEGKIQADNALLQCWRHKKPSTKAVLWFVGRNDCFMHPHVANTLFLDKGYDMYVLNYSCDGMCRKRGWLVDADYNSHNRIGTFDLYLNQIDGAMDIMNSYKKYDTTIGYAHSTGGPIFINYLIKRGDDFFDGFLFNSPFLDWSADAVGSDLEEFVIEHFDFLTMMTPLNNDSKLSVPACPEGVKEVDYLKSKIVLDSWSAKIWSLYYYDFRSRPLYTVTMTPGFAKGVHSAHDALLAVKKAKKCITMKPILCITSRSDDILQASETLTRIDTVGPDRCEIELVHNAHDIFLSEEESDVHMALQMSKTWMDKHNF